MCTAWHSTLDALDTTVHRTRHCTTHAEAITLRTTRLLFRRPSGPLQDVWLSSCWPHYTFGPCADQTRPFSIPRPTPRLSQSVSADVNILGTCFHADPSSTVQDVCLVSPPSPIGQNGEPRDRRNERDPVEQGERLSRRPFSRSAQL